MATQLQFRSGTTAENDLFTGAVGEPTYDTDTGALRIHDGTTMGGKIIDTLVDFQLPTAQNNYTWYRKYSTGWVEQGGILSSDTLTYPVTMADTNYVMFLQPMSTVGKYAMNCQNLTTTGATIGTEATSWHPYSWEVKGMAA